MFIGSVEKRKELLLIKVFFLGIMRRKKKKLKIRFKGEKGIKIEKVYKGIGGRGEVIGCSWNG